MKKFIYSVFAIVALAACNKAEAPEQTAAFRINVNPNSTKPVFDQDTYEVSWKADEQLHVLINEQAYTFSKTQDNDYSFECPEFRPVAGQEYNWEIVTPYRSDWGEKTFSFSGGVGPVMYGTGTTTGAETPSIHMNLLNSIVRLEIENTGETDITINEYRFESDTDLFGGRRTIVDGEVRLKDGVDPVNYTALTSGNNITVKAGETGYKCLQCGPFVATVGSKLKVTLTAGADVYTKEIDVTGPLEFKAGMVKTTHINIAKAKPEPEPVVGEASKVYIDFGKEKTTGDDATVWNTYNKRSKDEYVDLKNGVWEDSGLRMTTLAAFDGNGWNNGNISRTWTENTVVYPALVWRDAMLAITNPGELEISGCDVNKTYKIESLHIRYGGSRGPRVFNMEVTGKTTVERFDCGMPDNTAAGTYTYSIVFDDVTPDANGKINIKITPLLGSNGSTKEATINAMIITKN